MSKKSFKMNRKKYKKKDTRMKKVKFFIKSPARFQNLSPAEFPNFHRWKSFCGPPKIKSAENSVQISLSQIYVLKYSAQRSTS